MSQRSARKSTLEEIFEESISQRGALFVVKLQNKQNNSTFHYCLGQFLSPTSPTVEPSDAALLYPKESTACMHASMKTSLKVFQQLFMQVCYSACINEFK
jgi:hypothetical protein